MDTREPSFTILGASGFIGRHLVAALQAAGTACFAPRRGDAGVCERNLGHVIYCVGLTSDFRDYPIQTVQAHVCYLSSILSTANFESLLYLSSTRLYGRSDTTREDANFHVNPADPSDLYNLSKITGEALCLLSERPSVRVARLSNVYGPDMSPGFLSSLLGDALARRHIVLQTSFASAKDYVSVTDVVRLLPLIATSGRERIYNVAKGANTSNSELTEALTKLTGCSVEEAPGAPTIRFSPLSIERTRAEFAFNPAALLDDLAAMIAHYQRSIQDDHDQN